MKRRWKITGATVVAATAAWFFLGATDDAAMAEQARRQEYAQDMTGMAQEGDAAAQYALAVIYHNGTGKDLDVRAAARWYTRAAEQGHVVAQFAIGNLYATGEGVKQDYQKAAYWLTPAAGLGKHRDAQYALGTLYYHGRGVGHDYGTAISWYRLAAGQGHATAQYVLGTMYENGWGLEKDLVESYKWHTLAKSNRDRIMVSDPSFDPATALARLETLMNEAQITRARRAAAGWRPTR